MALRSGMAELDMVLKEKTRKNGSEQGAFFGRDLATAKNSWGRGGNV